MNIADYVYTDLHVCRMSHLSMGKLGCQDTKLAVKVLFQTSSEDLVSGKADGLISISLDRFIICIYYRLSG